MLARGKQISVYKIKEILNRQTSHVCCLTEDPFFHSTVLLKVYPINCLQDKQQRKRFKKRLEKLLLLEHPSIAPVFDSGFEGQYFYYTTDSKDKVSLIDQAKQGLLSGEILKIVRDLACALEHAIDRGLEHGHLTNESVYFGDDSQAVIADFGIDYSFKNYLGNQELEWQEEQALQDLGRLQLQLLRPSDVDNSGRESEIIDGIENQQLQQLTRRFFTERPDRYRSLSELIAAIDMLMETPPVETRPMVQRKSLAVSAKVGITDQQREQVLPHVRELITEKNRYKILLDEALLAQKKTDDQLKQTLLKIDQMTQMQLVAPEELRSAGRKKITAWALTGFVFGVILSGSYGYTLQQKNSQRSILEQANNISGTEALLVQSEPKSLPTTVEKTLLAQPQLTLDGLPNNVSAPAPGEQSFGSDSGQVKKIPVINETSRQWWPAGGEFSEAVAMSMPLGAQTVAVIDDVAPGALSVAEREEIFQKLSHWLDSWSKQDSAAYFSHYSERYRPEVGRSREEWLKFRKNRLLRPNWIEVQVRDVRMRRQADNLVQVKFQQNYRSSFYQDQIGKSLSLINENRAWKILTERSLGPIEPAVAR